VQQPPSSIPAIEQILPHQADMILLDQLVSAGGGKAQGRVHMDRLANFADGEGNVPSYLGIECMVQTVAAMIGWYRVQQGLKPLVGLILGTRSCRFAAAHLPSQGWLDIDIETVIMEDPLGVFASRLSAQGATLVEGELKAIQPQTELQLFELLHT